MSDAEFHDTMEGLQCQGYQIRWYVHGKNRFSKNLGFYSRHIAEAEAQKRGLCVTPEFDE